MRTAKIERRTKETNIALEIGLDDDGPGGNRICTGSGFFDHMLDLFGRHAGIRLMIEAEGDREVDDHHLVEDTGIVLGQAIAKALGDKAGICRAGFFVYPMDEALVLAAVDISGRGGLAFEVGFSTEKIGTFDTHLVKEFFQAVAANAGITLHFKALAGNNSHHLAESCFKAFARAFKSAIEFDPKSRGAIPSTKGVL